MKLGLSLNYSGLTSKPTNPAYTVLTLCRSWVGMRSLFWCCRMMMVTVVGESHRYFVKQNIVSACQDKYITEYK